MSRTLPRAAAVSIAAVPLALGAFVLFSLQDAGVKSLLGAGPIWQLLMIRAAVVLVIALAVGRTKLLLDLVHSRNKKQLLARAMIMLVAWLCFYQAAHELPLAQLTTLYFVSPFLVTLASGPLLGERPTRLQWIAVVLGFTGVAIAAGVQDFVFSPAVGLALIAAAFWATALLMLRRMGPDESSLVQIASSNGVFLMATLSGLAFHPFEPAFGEVRWMAMVALAGGMAQFLLYEAATRAPAPLIATLEYTAILCAFSFGWLFFAEVPGPNVFAGAALVVVSGLMVVAGTRFRRG
ncbi:DMT family transporter [Methylobrevis albus]|uniref:DMT family transporter n=1 Tax=Methylobrevis albus TaxID=2793297 RepID=A0A931MXK3_9HYPH|nr:DMT family transporter [Methylobrevis albus]MBH0239213.1 DMT family transporter [Methylobrevis albus]